MASIIAVILAVTPLFKIAIFPIVIALFCGIAIYFFTKKDGKKTKSIQYIFLLIIISLSILIYKSVFSEAEVGDIEELEKREDKSEEEAIELLEGIEIDD